MSHIETGNTKLSLPVPVKTAEILQVSTDTLLFENTTATKNSIIDEITNNLSCCNASQLMVINDIIKSAAIALNKYL